MSLPHMTAILVQALICQINYPLINHLNGISIGSFSSVVVLGKK